jgi:hypothetical protein
MGGCFFRQGSSDMGRGVSEGISANAMHHISLMTIEATKT